MADPYDLEPHLQNKQVFGSRKTQVCVTQMWYDLAIAYALSSSVRGSNVGIRNYDCHWNTPQKAIELLPRSID